MFHLCGGGFRSRAGRQKRSSLTDMQIRTNLGDFRHHHTMILKVYINTHEKGTQQRVDEFSPTCRQKPECQCSTTIYCQRNLIFYRQKKNYSIHYLIGQNQSLSGLKNIWPVIMTGDLLSVILSPATYVLLKYIKSLTLS